MSGGRMSNLLLEIIGLDMGEALRFLIGGIVFPSGGAADFGIKKGDEKPGLRFRRRTPRSPPTHHRPRQAHH
jgi:hypothetical protein